MKICIFRSETKCATYNKNVENNYLLIKEPNKHSEYIIMSILLFKQ